MPSKPESIDAYLASVTPEARTALEALRGQIRASAPDAEECISYAMPAFRWRGKLLAAFAAFKGHYSYFPCCSTALPNLPEEYRGFVASKGTLKFRYGVPVPDPLVAWLIAERKREIEG